MRSSVVTELIFAKILMPYFDDLLLPTGKDCESFFFTINYLRIDVVCF